MAIMPRTISTVIFLCLTALAAAAQSLPQSSSAQGFHSHVRLISGGRDGDRWLAGIEIVLDEGFKTYWRNPGESGLPPRFDWSRSENVSSIDLRWPAPSRYEDAAGVAHVYSGKVVLPVIVKPAQSGRPIRLALSADYGICKDICIPAHAELGLELADLGANRAAIEQALAKVPQPQQLGEGADLSILSSAPLSQGQPGFSVEIRAPSGTEPALFAEGPEDWYLSTSRIERGNRFTVTVDEKPKEASGPVSITLTLVSEGRAVETQVSLDGNGQPR